MHKVCKIFFLLIIFVLPDISNAHVEHYKDLNSIKFDIYRNGKNIGKHVFTFKKDNESLSVESEINFEIRKLGVVLYKYHVKGTEFYENGELIKFNSKTDQNKKKKIGKFEF